MANDEDMVVRWLPPDIQPPHPWGDLEILDVRSFALTMISTTTSILLAQNAASWSNDTGSSFIGQQPIVSSGESVPVFTFDPPLRYLLENKDYMAEGVVLTPKEMENKWAIFYYNNQLIFVRRYPMPLNVVFSPPFKSVVLIISVNKLDPRGTCSGGLPSKYRRLFRVDPIAWDTRRG